MIRLLFSFVFCIGLLNAKEFQILRLAAKVNGHAITNKDVETLLAPRRELLKTMFPREGVMYNKRLGEFRNQILEQLIDNQLLLTEAEGIGASIPDHVVDQEMARLVREDYNGKDAEFNAFLKENGLTRNSFREQQRKQILVQAYRSQQFGAMAPPTEEEIRQQYQKRKFIMRDRVKDEVEFKKIFLVAQDRLDPNVTPETQLAKAEKILLELKGGADFSELAKKHSNGAYATDGGVWPKSKRTDFALSFGEAIFEQSKEGDLVGPLKDPAGYTIVKVVKIYPGPTPPLSDEKIYERMKKEVNIEKRAAKYKTWIESLKAHAMIERFM